MNSPKLINIIVAVVFAVIAYFISDSVLSSPESLAIFVFVAALISSLINVKGSNESNESDDITTLYVGNLPYRANEGAVRALFAEYGNVHSVRLMKDKHTGKRRGFGFVEMSASNADNAISKLNDSEFQQRTLKVREAKERPEKSDNNE